MTVTIGLVGAGRRAAQVHAPTLAASQCPVPPFILPAEHLWHMRTRTVLAIMTIISSCTVVPRCSSIFG